jgi:hypothetical protein
MRGSPVDAAVCLQSPVIDPLPPPPPCLQHPLITLNVYLVLESQN